jgi:hypothetical protein
VLRPRVRSKAVPLRASLLAPGGRVLNPRSYHSAFRNSSTKREEARATMILYDAHSPGSQKISRRFAWLPLQPPRHSGLNDLSVGQHDNEVHLASWSFNRLIRKGDQPEWDRRRAKLLRLRCADLDVVECRHEVSSDLSRLLLGDSVWGNSAPRPRKRTPVCRRRWPRPGTIHQPQNVD